MVTLPLLSEPVKPLAPISQDDPQFLLQFIQRTSWLLTSCENAHHPVDF